MRDIHFKGVDGTPLFAVEDGAGPAVVMLHGAMADHRASLPLVAGLSSARRIVLPDLRASGRSKSAGPLSFDLLADDLARLLDHLAIDRAAVGGVSSGCGIPVRFALRHPSRASALVIVRPISAGARHGYTPAQRAIFAKMDAAAEEALRSGVAALFPLYADLPPGVRERALAMVESFDPASVRATTHLLASGAHPFESETELGRLSLPVLLFRGADPLHPAEVSDVYAVRIPHASVVAANTADVPGAIAAFLPAPA